MHDMDHLLGPTHLTLVSLVLVHHLPVCSALQAAAALQLLTTGCQGCQQTEEPDPTSSGLSPAVPLPPEQHRWTQSSLSLTESSHSLNRSLDKRGKKKTVQQVFRQTSQELKYCNTRHAWVHNRRSNVVLCVESDHSYNESEYEFGNKG